MRACGSVVVPDGPAALLEVRVPRGCIGALPRAFSLSGGALSDEVVCLVPNELHGGAPVTCCCICCGGGGRWTGKRTGIACGAGGPTALKLGCCWSLLRPWFGFSALTYILSLCQLSALQLQAFAQANITHRRISMGRRLAQFAHGLFLQNIFIFRLTFTPVTFTNETN